MHIKDILEIILAVCALTGIIYKIAQTEASIYKAIDSLKDGLIAQMCQNDSKFSIHLTEYSTRKEFVDYRIHGLDEKIDHKFNRCWDEIKQMKGYLQSQGFKSRE